MQSPLVQSAALQNPKGTPSRADAAPNSPALPLSEASSGNSALAIEDVKMLRPSFNEIALVVGDDEDSIRTLVKIFGERWHQALPACSQHGLKLTVVTCSKPDEVLAAVRERTKQGPVIVWSDGNYKLETGELKNGAQLLVALKQETGTIFSVLASGQIGHYGQNAEQFPKATSLLAKPLTMTAINRTLDQAYLHCFRNYQPGNPS